MMLFSMLGKKKSFFINNSKVLNETTNFRWGNCKALNYELAEKVNLISLL